MVGAGRLSMLKGDCNGDFKKSIVRICVLLLVIMLAMFFGIAAVDASPGDIVCFSTDSAGALGNSASVNSSISSEGRYIAFESVATNLVSGDTNGVGDVFRKELQTGAVVRCSTDSAGAQANDYSQSPSISPNGRYVAFESKAANLVSGDTNGAIDVFRKDLQTGAVVRCSTDSAGAQGNGDSFYSSISADGRYVAFESNAANLVSGDTNGASDIFRKDLSTGQIVRCSTDSAGAQGNGNSNIPSISADGRYVAFYSEATNLVSGDTNGALDVFRKDLQTDAIVRCSTDSAGAQGNGGSDSPSISADGGYVAFFSEATNLVSGDTNGATDIFRKDLKTGAIVRCSTDSAGAQSNGSSYHPSISSNGRYVAFESNAANLVSGDNNGTYDVFRKDLQAGAIERCSADSAGAQSNGSSYRPSISSEGRYVAFDSDATNLASGDTNGTLDVFRKELALPAPAMTSIVPENASQFAFFLNVEISGSGFQPAATARLEKGTSSILDIYNLNITDTNITGTVSLFGAEPGVYDVVVVNPGGEEARLSGKFTVTPICGQGSGAGLLILGLALGLLSFSGSSRLRRRSKKK